MIIKDEDVTPRTFQIERWGLSFFLLAFDPI